MVRPFQLTTMSQECLTLNIIVRLFLENFVQFIYLVIDAFSSIKVKTEIFELKIIRFDPLAPVKIKALLLPAE